MVSIKDPDQKTNPDADLDPDLIPDIGPDLDPARIKGNVQKTELLFKVMRV